jgi:hypothetical protein
VKLKLDLHEVYNRGQDIDRALAQIISEAVQIRADLVEIIPGKGSGQLKKRAMRFLDQREIKALYHRVEKDSKNFGRVFVHFRWRSRPLHVHSSCPEGRPDFLRARPSVGVVSTFRVDLQDQATASAAFGDARPGPRSCP